MKKFRTMTNRAVFETVNFSSFEQLMEDTAAGIQGVSKKEANEKIREVFRQVLGVDENVSRKELRKAIRRNRVEVFEVIETLIPNLLQTGWQANPFFEEFVDYRNGNDGDTNEFYVDDDTILTVSELSGNHHDIIRQRLGVGESFRVKTSWYGLKIYTEFELFLAGRVDWAKFIQKVYEAMDKKVNAMLYQAVMAAPAQVTPAGMFTKSLQMVAANRETVLQLVDDIQAATGDEVVIMGTRVALSKLAGMADTNYIADADKNERRTLGYVTLWEGIRIVTIPQAFEDNNISTTSRMVDNDKLLVMPVGDNKFIKMYDEGDARITEVNDQATKMDMTFEYEYQQKMGIATAINKKFGMITILP